MEENLITTTPTISLLGKEFPQKYIIIGGVVLAILVILTIAYFSNKKQTKVNHAKPSKQDQEVEEIEDIEHEEIESKPDSVHDKTHSPTFFMLEKKKKSDSISFIEVYNAYDDGYITREETAELMGYSMRTLARRIKELKDNAGSN